MEFYVKHMYNWKKNTGIVVDYQDDAVKEIHKILQNIFYISVHIEGCLFY